MTRIVLSLLCCGFRSMFCAAVPDIVPDTGGEGLTVEDRRSNGEPGIKCCPPLSDTVII